MQLAGDSAALALYAVHYCGNGEISGKIIPAVLTWGIKRYSGYEYPCILFIKHNLNIKKKEIWRKKQYACAQIGLLSQAKETSQLLVLFSTYENVLKLRHKCLWPLFSRYQQRLQPVWGEGGPAPCSLSTSSLPQHTDTACSSMTMQLKCRKFIVDAS